MNATIGRPDAALRVSTALLGAVGILAAAFGAHGLEKIAGPAEVRFWAIGAAIQLVTAPALFSASLHPERVRSVVGWLWVTGVVLFSGSLYAMALGGPRALGAVTPLGGLALTLGWLGLLLPKADAGGPKE